MHKSTNGVCHDTVQLLKHSLLSNQTLNVERT